MPTQTAIPTAAPTTTAATAANRNFSAGLVVSQNATITFLSRWSTCFVLDHWAISAVRAIRAACSASALAFASARLALGVERWLLSADAGDLLVGQVGLRSHIVAMIPNVAELHPARQERPGAVWQPH